jgi:hypothetical protein
VNTNHLHLSGYSNPMKGNSGVHNSSGEIDKKENYQDIIKNFKPSKQAAIGPSISGTSEDSKDYKFKQDIRTTKPKKSAKKPTGTSKKANANTSKKRSDSEPRRNLAIEEDKVIGKRSQSQPPVLDNIISSDVADYVVNYAIQTRTGMIPDKPDK